MNTLELISRYYQSLNAKDWAGFRATLSPDVVYEVPQTRERVRGLEAYIDFNTTYPGDWTLEVVRIIADETGASGQIRFLVDGQELTGISFFEIEDGLITHILDFWPEPYEPPTRHSRFVERY